MEKYKYEEVIPIIPHISTGWLIETEKESFLALWNKDAEITDVVKSIRNQLGGIKFSVFSVNVGMFKISTTEHSLCNGRGVDQDMNIVLK